MRDKINIGIIGFGTVGSGVVRILQRNEELIRRRLGATLHIKKIADLDLSRDRGVKLEKGVITKEAKDILNDPSIDIVAELIGGYEPARTYILEAFSKGKHVVTANKALLALHGEEIFQSAQKNNVDLGFEGSVGGGIPILRAIKEGLSADSIQSIYGIINGTSNYILTKMTQEKRGFDEVLFEAKGLGYAEADPTLDVEGIDSAHKLAILTTLSFGTPVKFDEIYTEGITKVTPLDIEFAKEFGYKIKLLAIAKLDNGEIEARVHPTMVPEEYLISTVDGVYNAIYVVGDGVGDVLFYGRGAGDMPTGSAVVGDIIDISRNIIKGATGRVPVASYNVDARKRLRIKKMEEILSLYYMRFMVEDRPGVLSKISGVLGKYDISISAVLQKGRKKDEAVPVVIMTHMAQEKNVRRALEEINVMPFVSEKTTLIRVEGQEK